jgi:endogenous inhibitor of DNA gyrase (YacG/DUF329 family)
MERKRGNEHKDVRFAARPCPICGKPSSFAERPFCSRRCADIDLHRWFTGTYAVPTQPNPAEDDERAPPADGPEQK